MKTKDFWNSKAGLVLAAAVAFVLFIVIKTVIDAFDPEEEYFKGLSLTPFGLTKQIQGFLAKALRRPSLRPAPAGVVNFEGFQIDWIQMTVYGALAIAASTQVGGFFGALIGGWIGGTEDFAIVSGVTLGLMSALAASLVLGRWVGIRASDPGWLAALGFVVSGRLIGAVLDFTLVPADVFEDIFAAERSFGTLVGLVTNVVWLEITAACLGFAFLGYWIGRQARRGKYLEHLLRQVDADTQQAIVELTYEELTSPGGKEMTPA